MIDLAASYEHCRQLHRRHGRTYYLATRLLPASSRPHVHALYGFARYADDLVDADAGLTADERSARFRDWSGRFLAHLSAPELDPSFPDPVLPALLDTVRRHDLPLAEFTAFLDSMAADLTVTEYATYADLLEYMAGSAAAVGTLMLPLLGSTDPEAAARPARELGNAFQLTNFIRDVGEDLDRGRIYLPLADLDAFGVTPGDLRRREPTTAIAALLAFEAERAERHYAAAEPGIALLDRRSRPCVRAAFTLYRDILTAVRRSGYDVFRRRARVPRRRRAAVAARELLRACLA